MEQTFKWGSWEIEYLIENYADKSNEEIRKGLYLLNKERDFFPDRGFPAIKKKAEALCLTKSIERKKQAIEESRNRVSFMNKKYEVKKIYDNENFITLPQFVLDKNRKNVI